MSQFIPSFHFTKPADKLKSEWCQEVINYYYHNTERKPLLDKKNVNEIEEYANGDFSMEPFKRLYKSIKKSFVANNPNISLGNNDTIDSKMQFEPLPLIPVKLNAAVSVLQKVPIEITVTALDALAAKKKNEDINFLKNKPKLEAELQPIADNLQLPKVDLGSTRHSAVPYSSSPYGIDLADEEQAEIFSNIIYSLGVEVSFETVLQIFYDIMKWSQIRRLKILDQYKFGVSCHSASISPLTGLPEQEYVHPLDIETPPSQLPDFSDTTHRFRYITKTALELFNYFSDEIPDKAAFERILNDDSTGYCQCNNLTKQSEGVWGTFKMELIKVEVRSVDWVGVVKKSKGKGRGFSYLTEDENKATEKIWAQNTYSFYWLKNTSHFFKIQRLDFAHRSKGQESIQNFSTDIFKSQNKSAVELSIKANKKAQVADIKMQYAILMSLPAGKYIDLKYLRGAIDGLTDDSEDNPAMTSNRYTMDSLIEMALERNIIIGDTEGFDGKHDGQLKPFMDIAGGVKSELEGYRITVADAKNEIGDFTGINDALTGQSPDPNGLIGLEKLRINSSLNALYYVSEAINAQEQSLIQVTSYGIESAIESGGKARDALVNMIGDKKVGVIDRLNEIPLHTLGVTISTKQREEERARFEARLTRLKQIGAISVGDEYMLDALQNPKDKIAVLAIREKQFIKREDERRKEDAQRQQDMIQATGQNQVQVQSAKDEGKIKQIYAEGDVQSKIAQLASQLGIQAEQFKGLIKKSLQDDRSRDQRSKSIDLLDKKSSLERTNPLV